MKAQAATNTLAAAKTQADINLVTALKCVEILKVAVLAGPFEQVCAGVFVRGSDDVMTSSNTSDASRQIQTFNP